MTYLQFLTFFAIFIHSIISQDLSPFIFRGKKAYEGQFPYQVIIHFAIPTLPEPRHICSGSIINPRWILTARHCLQTTDPPDYWLNHRVVVGSVHRNKGVSYEVEKGVVHPGDDWHTDIGILKTKTKIKFNWKTKAIPFYKHWVPSLKSVVFSGWGHDENEQVVDHLMYVKMRTVSNWVCEKWINSSNYTEAIDELLPLTNQDMCAYAGEKRGACFGDSGGGLELHGKLVGIISRGIPCATSVPDVFVRVSEYREWIRESIRNN